jgi:hypothetical protein
MKDVTKTSRKIQEQIQRFSKEATRGLRKPKKKFIKQMLYGMQASRDVKLSNVSRSLNEDIKLIKTENRLSRHIIAEDLTENINRNLLRYGKRRIKEDTVLALDLSDIHKPFAKKMDFLANVWDGSEGKKNKGYWLCEVVGAGVKEENPIPLYSELYSHRAEGFVSENNQIIKAIETVNDYVKGRGIWTMDRGADRRILVGKLDKMGLRFVIRAKGSRDVTDEMGRVRNIMEVVGRIRYKHSCKITVDREGCTEEIEVRLGVRHNLKIENTAVSVVAIKGVGQVPMVLITNTGKTAKEIFEIYLTRWKCEESFRFLKHEYHLEDVRVRRYIGLRNTVVLVHAVFYFLSVYLGKRLRMQILLSKILDKAKRFFQVPAFKNYAIADGIYRYLFNQKWVPGSEDEEILDTRQMAFLFP